MAYSYIQEDGSVAVCSLLSSVPKEQVWVDDLDLPDGGYFREQPQYNAEVTEFPEDRLFRGAWRLVNDALATDLPLAKEIAHDKRRRERAEAFAPLDIGATIPSKATQAEAARQVIRDADAIKQAAIDGAVDETELRGLL